MSEHPDRNNINYRQLRSTLELRVDEVVAAFPELFDHSVGKVGAFVAANSYFHVSTSLLVVRASFLRDCIG